MPLTLRSMVDGGLTDIRGGGPGSGRHPGGGRNLNDYRGKTLGQHSGRSIDQFLNTRKLSKTMDWDKAKRATLSVLTQKEGGPGHDGALIALHEAGIPA